MVSPGLAGRDAIPATAPAGSAKVVPSRNTAAPYCFPPTLNRDGWNSAGAVAATVTGTIALLPPAVFTVSDWTPEGVPDGICALTCPSPAKERNACCPAMITLVPLIDVGALMPLNRPLHVALPLAS